MGQVSQFQTWSLVCKVFGLKDLLCESPLLGATWGIISMEGNFTEEKNMANILERN